MTDIVPVRTSEMSTFDLMIPAAELARQICKTEFVPSSLRNRPEAVMAAMLAGHELGLPPLQSLAKIHVIDGRPSLAAELMRALVMAQGHDIWFEETSTTRCIVHGRRAGQDQATKVMWTLDDAKKAGLVNKQNWQRYPRAMLQARATGELCRLVFPDVVGGISYTKEELEDGFIFDDAAEPPVANAAAVGPASTSRKMAAPKKQAAKKTAARKQATPSAAAAAPLPPLPGETTAGDDKAALGRAQNMAIRARDHNIDHHHLVAAVTGNQKTSAKDVTDEEAHDFFTALANIRGGLKTLEHDDERGWYLADRDPNEWPPPDDPPEPIDTTARTVESSGDEAGWDADEWRRYIGDRRVSVSAVVREAQRLAKELADDEPGPEPTTLGALTGRPQLAALVRIFIEDQAEGGS